MADIQRDKDIIKTPPLVLEPIFELPPDLDEGTYVSRDLADNSGDVYENGLIVDPTDKDPDAPLKDPGANPDDNTTPDGRFDPSIDLNPFPPFAPTLDPRPLGAPTEITVKSQTFRFSSDGTAVVDVVLEFPDAAGANSYEVRLAK